MPRIVSVRSRKKSLMAVFLDEPYYLGGREYGPREPLLIDRSLWEEQPLPVGGSLTEEELEALKEASDLRRAKEKALRLLSLRDYAAGELQKKLERDYCPAAAKQAARRMEELGLIHDDAYALRLAQDLMERKKLSARAALQELKARGIDTVLAETAVQQVEIDPAGQITAFAAKKYPRWREDERIRTRMVGALLRRGFTAREIRGALALPEENEF